MSARNWAECPKCLLIAKRQKAKYTKKAERQYGKIALEQYLAIKARADKQIDVGKTLAEYYEFGADEDGTQVVFHMNYNCYCKVCGLTFQQKLDTPVRDNSTDMD